MNHDDFSILGFALVAVGSYPLPRLTFPGFPMVNVRTKVTLEPLGFCKILKVSWSLQFVDFFDRFAASLAAGGL